MNDNTAKLIEQLASKLGTTSQYLWGVLLKQAPIDATITLVQVVIIWIFGFILLKTHLKLSEEKEYDGYKCTGYRHYEMAAELPMVLGAVLFLILVPISLFCFSDIINGYFNPEYWALNKIMNSIK